MQKIRKLLKVVKKMAKKGRGKKFESNFSDSIDYPLKCYRLKDSTASWGDSCPTCKSSMIKMCPTCKTTKKSQMTYAPKNICDFVVRNPIQRQVHWWELKEFKGKSLPFNNIDLGKLEKLASEDYSDSYGFEFGWIGVFASELELCFAIPAKKAWRFVQDMRSGETYGNEKRPRKSFPISWMNENAIRVPVSYTRGKKNYRYDFSVVMDDF